MADRDPVQFVPKALQILDGAAAAFFDLGFEGASMDEIARRSKVSKPTLYIHFLDKRAVFTAFVQRECARRAAEIFQVDLAASTTIELTLQAVAHRLLDVMLMPFAEGIYRVVVAEAARFPDVGRAFYASAIDLSARRLAVVLAAAVGRGELRIDDVELAAHQFLELCRADLVHRRLFDPAVAAPPEQRARTVDATVSMFMRAYRP